MQNDKNKNENKMTRAELLREIERQKAIIAAKERGEDADTAEDEKGAAPQCESTEAEKTCAEEPKKTVIKKIGKALYIVFNVVLALILFVNLYMIAARQIFKKENPTVFGLGYFVVTTASMDGDKPDSIEAGTLVFTVKQRSYDVGDIITFESKSVPSVTHRIVSINEDGSYTTRGDANNTDDSEPVYRESIAGRVFATVSGAAGVISALTSPVGLLILACVTLGIFGVPLILGSYDDGTEEQK